MRKGEGGLRHVIVLGNEAPSEDGFETWSQFLQRAQSVFTTDNLFHREENKVKAEDVLNLQFTSGTPIAPCQSG